MRSLIANDLLCFDFMTGFDGFPVFMLDALIKQSLTSRRQWEEAKSAIRVNLGIDWLRLTRVSCSVKCVTEINATDMQANIFLHES